MKLCPRASRPPVPQRRRRKYCAISPHILWLVFLRLPLKSLFRCKAVCKAFYSVVSDPLFSADYRKISPPKPSGFLLCAGFLVVQRKSGDSGNPHNYSIRFIECVGNIRDRVPSEKDLNHPFSDYTTILRRRRHSRTPPYYNNKIISSSGGVLLCGGMRFETGPNCHRYGYYVVNPLTKEWRALPRLPIAGSEKFSSVVGFVCREGDPSVTGASNYSYEVVHIHRGRIIDWENMIIVVQTYSTTSHEWSVVSVISGFSCSYWSSKSRLIAIGGVFYYMCLRNLISYDPATYKFEEWPLPIPRGTYRGFCIGDGTNEALLLCVSDIHGFEVWVKDECRQRLHPWRRKHRMEWLEIEMLVAQSPSCSNGKRALDPCTWRVRAFQEDPDKVLAERFPEVFSYDLRTGKLEMLHDGQGLVPSSLGEYHPYHLPSWHFLLQ